MREIAPAISLRAEIAMESTDAETDRRPAPCRARLDTALRAVRDIVEGTGRALNVGAEMSVESPISARANRDQTSQSHVRCIGIP